MSTVNSPKFCPECGRPAGASSPHCACGYRLAAESGAAPPPAPPVGLWASLAWRRLAAVVSGHPTGGLELPWQAAVLSVVVRALVAAMLIEGWADALLAEWMRAVNGTIPFGPLFHGQDLPLPGFTPVLFALLVAAAVSLLVLYFGSSRGEYPQAAAALADAQWSLAGGLVAAWMLSYVSTLVAAGALAASVAWGQALLAAGLGRLSLTHRQRIVLQSVIAAISTMAVLITLTESVRRAALRGL